MAGNGKPEDTGPHRPGAKDGGRDDRDLASRSRALEAALAARRPAQSEGAGRDGRSGGMAGFGQALRLSGDFIAGVVVGAGIGWFIDTLAGTSPWGLIVFLLLGFVAGVLNVLRSAGLVAQPGPKATRGDAGRGDVK